jgi:hypothetical protein
MVRQGGSTDVGASSDFTSSVVHKQLPYRRLRVATSGVQRQTRLPAPGGLVATGVSSSVCRKTLLANQATVASGKRVFSSWRVTLPLDGLRTPLDALSVLFDLYRHDAGCWCIRWCRNCR